MLRSSRGLSVAALVWLAAGCGGDSKPATAQPSGLSTEKAVAAGTASAARSALLTYAQKRQGDISNRLAQIMPPPVEPAPPVPEQPGKGPGPQPVPGSGMTPAPAPVPAPDPMLALTPEQQREIVKTQAKLARWVGLVQALKGSAPDSCFKVKEHKLSEEKAEQATSRLVLSLTAGYQDMADGDLVFDLSWRRLVTTLYKSRPRADWMLSGSQLVSGGKED